MQYWITWKTDPRRIPPTWKIVHRFSAQISPSQLRRRDQKNMSTVATSPKPFHFLCKLPGIKTCPHPPKNATFHRLLIHPTHLPLTVVSRLTTTGVSRDINLKGNFDKLVQVQVRFLFSLLEPNLPFLEMWICVISTLLKCLVHFLKLLLWGLQSTMVIPKGFRLSFEGAYTSKHFPWIVTICPCQVFK